MQKIFVSQRIHKTHFRHKHLHMRNRSRIQYINLRQRFYPIRPRTIYLTHRFSQSTLEFRYHLFQVQHHIQTDQESVLHPAPCLLYRVHLRWYNHNTTGNIMLPNSRTPSMMLNHNHIIAITETSTSRILCQPLIMLQSNLMMHLL